ncbi:hypothetical protein C0V72_02000 [Porphyrobacter sp. TH134]|uniref:LuxR C-terminal-related transcriptional regulator n=1 Tax=Porphyrobacter sp. TH134 TaxID=2067450 RepID=UPI000C7AE362|nr:LuxR C-terminal-related transcriptional regulator [Porphyrobacter sp. TH134]PLK25419.1 hypothetical protein C0V72_02000 [Porphyrobacter sp. TH134]
MKADPGAATIERITREAIEVHKARRLTIEARDKLSLLSGRESAVLGALATGRSHKEIARLLQISPRIVAIHRANMTTKRGAGSIAAEPLRILEAKPVHAIA